MGKSTIQDTLYSGADGFDQAQVYIVGAGIPNQGRVQALMTGEFSISAGSAFNMPMAAATLENVSQGINMVKGAIESGSQVIGANVDMGAQIQLKHLSQTENFWTGSERPVFSVELLYISLVRGFDVRTQVLNLYRTVMPTKGGAFGLDFLLKAPLGYDPATRKGLLSIQLGTWFRASAQVMKSVQFTYSQEMVPLNGDKNTEATKFAPLYAKGSITFEPYRDITYSDFAGYFIGG